MISMKAKALALSALVLPSVSLAQKAVSLDWDQEGNVDGWRLYQSQAAGNYGAPLLTTTNKPVTTPVLPLGTHFFRVTAFIGDLESEPSNEVSTVTLAPPTNLRLESGTNFAFPMKLVWDKSTSSTVYGDTKYRVYRRNKTPESATWYRITETANAYYSAQILQAGSYVFRVSALKGNYESPTSSNDIFVTVRLAAAQEN